MLNQPVVTADNDYDDDDIVKSLVDKQLD